MTGSGTRSTASASGPGRRPASSAPPLPAVSPGSLPSTQNHRAVAEPRVPSMPLRSSCQQDGGRGGEHTTENTTLTRYKNSRLYCRSVLNISSQNLLGWKHSSCSQFTLWSDDESPSQTGHGAGLETRPGTVPLTSRQLCAGALGRWGQTRTPAPLRCPGLGSPAAGE